MRSRILTIFVALAGAALLLVLTVLVAYEASRKPRWRGVSLLEVRRPRGKLYYLDVEKLEEPARYAPIFKARTVLMLGAPPGEHALSLQERRYSALGNFSTATFALTGNPRRDVQFLTGLTEPLTRKEMFPVLVVGDMQTPEFAAFLAGVRVLFEGWRVEDARWELRRRLQRPIPEAARPVLEELEKYECVQPIKVPLTSEAAARGEAADGE